MPQELDDLRWSQSAATMLKFGNLNTPYMFKSAARAVFNVIDEAGLPPPASSRSQHETPVT